MAPNTHANRSYEEWRLTHPVIAGGAPDDDDAEDGDTDDTTQVITDDRAPETTSEDEDTTGDETQADPYGNQSEGELIAALERTRAENERLKREAGQREKARRTAERAKMAAEGKWQDIAEEMTRERDIERQSREAADKRYNDLLLEVHVTRIASNLNFRDPSDAARFIDDDIDLDSDGAAKVIEHTLRQVAKRKPYLVDNQRRSGAPVNGATGRALQPQEQMNGIVAQLLRNANASQD